MATTTQDMAENVKRVLTKNGFPQNSVALPLERLYESAHRDGLNFNKVLDILKDEGIAHEKTSEKIIFRITTPEAGVNEQNGQNPFAGIDFEAVRKIYENMTPEQRASVMEMAQKMGAGL